jgi:hypothetical protein
MNEDANESFRAQVDRLVAEGKLTAEEAAGLLEGTEVESAALDPREIKAHYTASGDDDTPPDLTLEVTGFTLQVVVDSSVIGPQLHANEEGLLLLEAVADGWRVARRPDQKLAGWSNLRAILTLPFAPRHVRARVEGGNLTLPDLGGEMLADVNGGNLRMGRAASLRADVNGGNLTATEMGGPTHLSVNGGNLTLEGAHTLNASVNGGNLNWAGRLTGGDHRVEVNAGNATLHLLPGSSVQLDADVTIGAFKADFPTHKQGGFLNTRHAGQLGSGDARLSCKVAAGQIKVVTQ